MGVFDHPFIMKVIFAFALLIAAASAAHVSAKATCEQQNVVLKEALVRLAKKDMAQADCSTCFTDILAAATDCFFSGTWLQCIEDVLGAGNPCINCVCEVVTDVCGALGCSWGC